MKVILLFTILIITSCSTLTLEPSRDVYVSPESESVDSTRSPASAEPAFTPLENFDQVEKDLEELKNYKQVEEYL